MNSSPLLFQLGSVSGSIAGPSGTTPAGLHYVYLLENVQKLTHHLTGICAIGLPFHTDSHLVGIPIAKKGLIDVKTLEPVVLEGDYQDYFCVYAEKFEQIESRVLLNPESMVYSIEFCSAYLWEIVDDTLYFANDGELPNLSVIDTFVQQIKPVLAAPAGIELTAMPQTTEVLSKRPSRLLCPVCQGFLYPGYHWLACPQGHGYLLTGDELLQTRQHINDTRRALKSFLGTPPAVVTPVVVMAHDDIHCPIDGVIMAKKQYQQTDASLYVCAQCSYRWIDGQDLDAILGPYRNDGEDEPDTSVGDDVQLTHETSTY